MTNGVGWGRGWITHRFVPVNYSAQSQVEKFKINSKPIIFFIIL